VPLAAAAKHFQQQTALNTVDCSHKPKAEAVLSSNTLFLASDNSHYAVFILTALNGT